MMNPVRPQKRYGQAAFAIILMLSGIIANVVDSNNYMVSSLGLLSFIFGARLLSVTNVRNRKPARASVSDVRNPKTVRATSYQDLNPEAYKRPGYLAWIFGVASILATVISYMCIYQDARTGGHEGWPADAFAWSAIIAAAVWGYIFSKFW